MRANPIYRDLKGAPFKIGERVRIERSEDDTFNSSYRGWVGIVKYFEYDCGCGQSYPIDPMIGIEFKNGKTEEFWKEELRYYPGPHKHSSHNQRSR